MKTLTSTKNPIRLDYVETGRRGRLGLTIMPGKRGQSHTESVYHDRDGYADIETMKALGVSMVVSLLDYNEHDDNGFGDLYQAYIDAGIQLVRVPTKNLTPVPFKSALEAIQVATAEQLRSGTVAVHCLGGLGRAGSWAAYYLIAHGMAPGDAISTVRASRPGAIETVGQERAIATFGEMFRGIMTPGGE